MFPQKVIGAVALFGISQHVCAQEISNSMLASVKSRLGESAKRSWELGARAQVIVESDAPDFSVFSPKSLPPPTSIPASLNTSMEPIIQLTRNVINDRARSNNNKKGPQPFMEDGSVADPASLGVSVLLCNWTGQTGTDYAGAAKDQLDFLLNVAPRSSEGAISHRESEVQLWSDFMYMVPPFLAYYGVLGNNRTLVAEAYNQIKLYRDALRDTKANNLWKHIDRGDTKDDGHWSTGNGWAAAGMLRVLATMKRSSFSDSFKGEQNDLRAWVKEIHAGMYAKLDGTSIFRNYVDKSSTFYDASSTALLASTVYRTALLTDDHSHLPSAERSRKALSETNGGNGNGNYKHFTSEGWLTPVVDPHSVGNEGKESPEGQAFVVAMQAAWKDWVADGSKGANLSKRNSIPGTGWLCGLSALMILLAF